MNKFVILLVTLLVAVALCACGASGDATQPNADPTENNSGVQTDPTSGVVIDPTAGNIEATDPQPTTGSEEPTEPSATDEPTEPAVTTNPSEPVDQPTTPTEPEPSEPTSGKVTYYDYYFVFTAEQQMEFINSFESIEAFFEWNKAAKEEYESGMKPINPDGSIDLGQ